MLVPWRELTHNTPENYRTWSLKIGCLDRCFSLFISFVFSFFGVFLPLVFGGVALLWQLYAFGNDSNAKPVLHPEGL